jgi:hypothetical protein
MQPLRNALAVLVAGLLVPALLHADVPDQNLNGTWRLDWDRSESFAPALKAMEVGWFMRSLAGVARVNVGIRSIPPECETCPNALEIVFSTPIATNSEVVFLDDEPRPGTDPQGNSTMDRYTRTDDGGVKMVRETTLPSGKQARLVETRTLGDAENLMLSHLVVFVEDERKASVHRTFVRADSLVSRRSR